MFLSTCPQNILNVSLVSSWSQPLGIFHSFFSLLSLMWMIFPQTSVLTSIKLHLYSLNQITKSSQVHLFLPTYIISQIQCLLSGSPKLTPSPSAQESHFWLPNSGTGSPSTNLSHEHFTGCRTVTSPAAPGFCIHAGPWISLLHDGGFPT